MENIDKDFLIEPPLEIVDEGFLVDPLEGVDESFLVPPLEEVDEGFLIEQEPQVEESIDETMQVEICGCGKCEQCRELELALVEGICSCEYEEIVKQDEEENEYKEKVLVRKCELCSTKENINLKYDNYRLMEKANINKEFWDECKVVDGIIYTPNEEGHRSNNDMIWDTLDYLTKPLDVIVTKE